MVSGGTATARFFSGKFVVEVFYALEDGAVVKGALVENADGSVTTAKRLVR